MMAMTRIHIVHVSHAMTHVSVMKRRKRGLGELMIVKIGTNEARNEDTSMDHQVTEKEFQVAEANMMTIGKSIEAHVQVGMVNIAGDDLF